MEDIKEAQLRQRETIRFVLNDNEESYNDSFVGTGGMKHPCDDEEEFVDDSERSDEMHQMKEAQRQQREALSLVVDASFNASVASVGAFDMNGSGHSHVSKGALRQPPRSPPTTEKKKRKKKKKRSDLRSKFLMESLRQEYCQLQQENEILREIVQDRLPRSVAKTVLDGTGIKWTLKDPPMSLLEESKQQMSFRGGGGCTSQSSLNNSKGVLGLVTAKAPPPPQSAARRSAAAVAAADTEVHQHGAFHARGTEARMQRKGSLTPLEANNVRRMSLLSRCSSDYTRDTAYEESRGSIISDDLEGYYTDDNGETTLVATCSAVVTAPETAPPSGNSSSKGLVCVNAMTVSDEVMDAVLVNDPPPSFRNCHIIQTSCDKAEGWEACKAFCVPGATFHCQSETLKDIKTVEGYANWCSWFATCCPSVSYTNNAITWDGAMSTAVYYSTYHAKHTVQGEGAPPPTFQQTNSEYVYFIRTNADGKIVHMTKLWNDQWALHELGWK